ncbi:hypothetical protein M758_1G256500 [Ceratodon purpureus]|uniref:Uncharacterized protein n=1 Tax=Ceratodon purpureus TaxID=3225 RepID=A0A8T0JCK7_CERPU|nr:hypothetical protein KC19_1G262900 [Ceratodon purpureus]KAG0631478.1 hypothetical protein M758_1G256500 [Ceratodon purpureus]
MQQIRSQNKLPSQTPQPKLFTSPNPHTLFTAQIPSNEENPRFLLPTTKACDHENTTNTTDPNASLTHTHSAQFSHHTIAIKFPKRIPPLVKTRPRSHLVPPKCSEVNKQKPRPIKTSPNHQFPYSQKLKSTYKTKKQKTNPQIQTTIYKRWKKTEQMSYVPWWSRRGK